MFSKSSFTILFLGALFGCSTEQGGKQPIRYRTLDPQDRVGTAIEVVTKPQTRVRSSTMESKTQALSDLAKPVVEPKPPVVTNLAPDSVAKSKDSTEKNLPPVASGDSVVVKPLPVQTTSPSTNTRSSVDKGAKVLSPEDEFFR